MLLLFSHKVASNSFATPWTLDHQAPLSMGFTRQEYWSWLPFPSPGDLPDQGIAPVSPAVTGRFFTTEPPGKPKEELNYEKTWNKEQKSEIAGVKPTIVNAHYYVWESHHKHWTFASGETKILVPVGLRSHFHQLINT